MDNLIKEIEKCEKILIENDRKNEEKIEFLNKTIERLKIPESVFELCTILKKKKTIDFFDLKITDCILMELILKFPECDMEDLKDLINKIDSINDCDGSLYVDTLEEVNTSIIEMMKVLTVGLQDTNDKEFAFLLTKLLVEKRELTKEEQEKFDNYLETFEDNMKKHKIDQEDIDDTINLLLFLIKNATLSLEEQEEDLEKLKDFFPTMHKLIPSKEGKGIFIRLLSIIKEKGCRDLTLSACALKQMKENYQLNPQEDVYITSVCKLYDLLEHHGHYFTVKSYIYRVEQFKKKKNDKKKSYLKELKKHLENLPKDKYISYTERLNNILYTDELKFEYLSYLLKQNELEYEKVKDETLAILSKIKVDRLLEKNKINVDLLKEHTKEVLYTKDTEELKELLDILSQANFSFINQSIEEFDELLLTLNPKTLSSISNLLKLKYISPVFLSRNLDVLLKKEDYNKDENKLITSGKFEILNENFKILKEKIPNITFVKSRNSKLLLMDKETLKTNLSYLDKYKINVQKLTIFDCIEDPSLFSLVDFFKEENKKYILENNPNILTRKNKYLKEKILLLKQLNIPYESKDNELLPILLQENFNIGGILIPDQEIENYLIEDIVKIKQKKK